MKYRCTIRVTLVTEVDADNIQAAIDLAETSYAGDCQVTSYVCTKIEEENSDFLVANN